MPLPCQFGLLVSIGFQNKCKHVFKNIVPGPPPYLQNKTYNLDLETLVCLLCVLQLLGPEVNPGVQELTVFYFTVRLKGNPFFPVPEDRSKIASLLVN